MDEGLEKTKILIDAWDQIGDLQDRLAEATIERVRRALNGHSVIRTSEVRAALNGEEA
jgi:hypothetical protein